MNGLDFYLGELLALCAGVRWDLVSLPLVAASVGWVTNYLAIKLLFHPRQPISIFGLRIQGVFPKRQQQFAEKVADVVASQLVTADDLGAAVKEIAGDSAVIAKVSAVVQRTVEEELRGVLPTVALFLAGNIQNLVRARIEARVPGLLVALGDEVGAALVARSDISALVRRKVEEFSSDELEKLVVQVMHREFRAVELSGAVFGFVIGLIQVVLFR